MTGQKDTVGADMFLRKYDSTGAWQWMKTYNSGGTQEDQGRAVAVDSGGNIYVTGQQETNGIDMFLRKYDSAGTWQWMQTYDSGGTGTQEDYGRVSLLIQAAISISTLDILRPICHNLLI